MPTVKLQNGNVILKDGKVSCSCCAVEPDCCMYPADKLGATPGFVAADLPATLYGKWADRADGTFTKSGDEYTLGTVTIRVNAGGTAWEFYDSTDDATSTIGSCLIRGDGNITPGNDAVEDQFDDEIEISWSGGLFDDGAASAIRDSLCAWNPDNYPVLGVELSLDSGLIVWNETDCVWEARFTAADIGSTVYIWVKESPQNTPEGHYVYDRVES